MKISLLFQLQDLQSSNTKIQNITGLTPSVLDGLSGRRSGFETCAPSPDRTSRSYAQSFGMYLVCHSIFALTLPLWNPMGQNENQGAVGWDNKLDAVSTQG